MRVNRLALIALVIGIALLCVWGYSLTQKMEVEVVEKLPVYNLEGEQIGYVEKHKTLYTEWKFASFLSLLGGLLLTMEGFIFLKPDDP